MSSPKQLILDVDTGCDDALALLLALRCPLVKVLAVTCVHGNVGIETVLQNTLKVLDAAEAPDDLPVAKGFREPLVEPVTHCPEIHGQDGMGDLQPAVPPSSRKPRSCHAVELLNGELRKAAGSVTVVALAPLTNVAVAIRTDPDLWKAKVERVVWMGGAVTSGGNASTWAEANARYDPEAAHIVLSSGVPILMYPWDVFLKVGYGKEELLALGVPDIDADGGRRQCEAAKRGSASELAGRLLYREMRHFGSDEGKLGDAGAVAAALLPSAITVKSLHVAMELQGGRTRGMTICDVRPFAHPPDDPKLPANVDVVVDVDAAALKAFYAQHVLAAGEDDAAKRRRTS